MEQDDFVTEQFLDCILTANEKSFAMMPHEFPAASNYEFANQLATTLVFLHPHAYIAARKGTQYARYRVLKFQGDAVRSKIVFVLIGGIIIDVFQILLDATN